MASFGYAGKIALIDVGRQSVETFDTSDYESWVGGHGLASALFWEFCEDMTVDAHDPKNLIVMAANPFSGTLVPTGSSRIEVTGIGSFSNPEWYMRSSMGGRLGGGLKSSGFDAVMVKGKSETPLWINVENGEITFHDARDLWGLDTWETQEVLWNEILGSDASGDWHSFDQTRDGGFTTQKPAVVCIGPAGENLSRLATLAHDAGHAAGQSGFGSVFGSKNLKAISFFGTQSITVADPAELLDIRIELQQEAGYNVDEPAWETPDPAMSGWWGTYVRNPGWGITGYAMSDRPNRPEGCQGCFRSCRHIFSDSVGNEAYCVAASYYLESDDLTDMLKTANILNKLGINGYDSGIHCYLYALYQMGVAGPGAEIDTGDLDFTRYNSFDFIQQFLNQIAYREGIGDDLAEGLPRAATKWGRWEEDSASGLLRYPQWGYAEHYDPRLEVDWSYGSVFGERDINEHTFCWFVHFLPGIAGLLGLEPPMTAEKVTALLAEGTRLGDPLCWDYSEEGIYSDPRLEAVAWQRHYTRFWIQSMCMCDWGWPPIVNFNAPDGNFAFDFGTYETRMYKAVTGKELSFEESLELGRKIFTLDRAIWAIQGRHRDQEVFAEYVYTQPTDMYYALPAFENGKWVWSGCEGRVLDRKRFEDFKTRFYLHEGYVPETGCPSQETLESLDLGEVAQALIQAGKL